MDICEKLCCYEGVIIMRTHLIGLLDCPVVSLMCKLSPDFAQQLFVDVLEVEGVGCPQRVVPSSPRCGLIYYQGLSGRLLGVMSLFMRSECHPKTQVGF